MERSMIRGYPPWANCAACFSDKGRGGYIYGAQSFYILPCVHVVCSKDCLQKCRNLKTTDGVNTKATGGIISSCPLCSTSFSESQMIARTEFLLLAIKLSLAEIPENISNSQEVEPQTGEIATEEHPKILIVEEGKNSELELSKILNLEKEKDSESEQPKTMNLEEDKKSESEQSKTLNFEADKKSESEQPKTLNLEADKKSESEQPKTLNLEADKKSESEQPKTLSLEADKKSESEQPKILSLEEGKTSKPESEPKFPDEQVFFIDSPEDKGIRIKNEPEDRDEASEEEEEMGGVQQSGTNQEMALSTAFLKVETNIDQQVQQIDEQNFEENNSFVISNVRTLNVVEEPSKNAVENSKKIEVKLGSGETVSCSLRKIAENLANRQAQPWKTYYKIIRPKKVEPPKVSLPIEEPEAELHPTEDPLAITENDRPPVLSPQPRTPRISANKKSLSSSPARRPQMPPPVTKPAPDSNPSDAVCLTKKFNRILPNCPKFSSVDDARRWVIEQMRWKYVDCNNRTRNIRIYYTCNQDACPAGLQICQIYRQESVQILLSVDKHSSTCKNISVSKITVEKNNSEDRMRLKRKSRSRAKSPDSDTDSLISEYIPSSCKNRKIANNPKVSLDISGGRPKRSITRRNQEDWVDSDKIVDIIAAEENENEKMWTKLRGKKSC